MIGKSVFKGRDLVNDQLSCHKRRLSQCKRAQLAAELSSSSVRFLSVCTELRLGRFDLLDSETYLQTASVFWLRSTLWSLLNWVNTIWVAILGQMRYEISGMAFRSPFSRNLNSCEEITTILLKRYTHEHANSSFLNLSSLFPSVFIQGHITGGITQQKERHGRLLKGRFLDKRWRDTI